MEALLENQFAFDFFKLHGNPFSRTAGTNHQPYMSSSFREALASLYYGLEYGGRILVLSADEGLGKTTLLSHLERRMRDRGRSLFVSSNTDKASEVLRKLLVEIGGAAANDDLHAIRQQTDEILPTVVGADAPFILLVDYNENAAGPALEIVRHLTNLESLQKGLLRVVIAGPPAVAEELQRAKFAEDILHVPLAPLMAAEVESYIEYRLRSVGWRGGSLFTAEDCAAIAERSSGKPSAINEICLNVLQGLSKPEKGRSDGMEHSQEALLDESYADFAKPRPKSASDELPDNAALHTTPPAPLLNHRAAALARIVLISVIAIAGLWYQVAIKANSAKHVTTDITSPFATSVHNAVLHDGPLARLPNPAHATTATGVAGKGVTARPTAEAGSASVRDVDAARLSHVALRPVLPITSPEAGKPTTLNTVSVRLTKGLPLVLSSPPAIAAPKNAGEYPTEPVGKKEPKVSGAPFSRTASASRTSTALSVPPQTTAPQTAAAPQTAVTAGEDTAGAKPSAEEMADYEIRRGDAYMNMGDYDKAVLSFSIAIAFAPDNKEAQEKMKRAGNAKAAEENVLQ